MSKPDQAQLDEAFEAMKAAMLETSRGAWFLERYLREAYGQSHQEILASLQSMRVAGATKPGDGKIEYLRHELQEMAASILETRREIAAIKPKSNGDNRIMAATEELDAIVSSTERATSEILGVAERFQDAIERLRESGADEKLCDELDEGTISIFMACSFQDITGQRTTKVVNVLRYLEARVNAMVQIWGDTKEVAPNAAAMKPDDERPDAHLLNGPQMEGEGVSQEDIDRMLSGDGAADAVAALFDEPAGDAGEALESEPDAATAGDVPDEAASEAGGPTENDTSPAEDDDTLGADIVDQGDIDALFEDNNAA